MCVAICGDKSGHGPISSSWPKILNIGAKYSKFKPPEPPPRQKKKKHFKTQTPNRSRNKSEKFLSTQKKIMQTIFIALQCYQCSTMQAPSSLSFSHFYQSFCSSTHPQTETFFFFFACPGEAKEEEQQQMDMRSLQPEAVRKESLCSRLHG